MEDNLSRASNEPLRSFKFYNHGFQPGKGPIIRGLLRDCKTSIFAKFRLKPWTSLRRQCGARLRDWPRPVLWRPYQLQQPRPGRFSMLSQWTSRGCLVRKVTQEAASISAMASRTRLCWRRVKCGATTYATSPPGHAPPGTVDLVTRPAFKCAIINCGIHIRKKFLILQ